MNSKENDLPAHTPPASDATAGREGAAMHVRARLLPDGHERDLWITEDGRISGAPVDGARTVARGGWVMPALVDSHVHLGVSEIGGPLDLDHLETELDELARTGVGAARVLGSPTPIPDRLLRQDGRPLLHHAGVALAAPERFIPGWGRRVGSDELAGAAASQPPSEWVKIVADWFDDAGGYGPAFGQQAIEDAVAASHRAGVRVAVHTQSAEGGRAAVAAGADSIEHGMHLEPETLPTLAAAGGVLVPTGTVFTQLAGSMAGDEVPAGLQRWYHDGLDAHPGLVRYARDEGVTILAGTDLPIGALIDEIQWLIAAGLPAVEAIGAASWTAREALGLPRLRDGDRADLVWTAQDPRQDIEVLRAPDVVILDGKVIGA